MDKNRIVFVILLLLLISPLIGIVVPWLHYFIPIAVAFNMPIDSPPFSEALMPLFGCLSILIGTVSFAIFFFSKGQKVLMLKVYSSLFILYNSFALLIWLLFFGVRFYHHFPIKEIGFYAVWASAVVPHVVWITILVWCIRTLGNIAKERQFNG